MRLSGPILILSSMLAILCLVLYMIGGDRSGIPGGEVLGGAVSSAPSEHSIQELLSGEFKRDPKKNPEAGDGRLRCVVLDETGTPVPGASVQVTPADPGADILAPRPEYRHYWEAETGDGGYVAFRTLPPGTYLVIASQNGAHGVAQVAVPDSGAFGEATLIVAPVAPVRGVVRDEAGAPVAGAVVVPVRAPGWVGDAGPYRLIPVETGESGNFAHPLLPAGDWEFLVSAKSFAPQLVVARGGEPVSVRLDGGRSFTGQVLREDDGKPLSNAKVVLHALDGPGESYTVRSNGQGLLVVEQLRPARYRLTLASDTYTGSLEIDLPKAGRQDAVGATAEARNVRLDPLTGTAVSAAPSTAAGAGSAPAAPVLQTLFARLAGSTRGRVLAGHADIGVPGVHIAAYRAGVMESAATAVSDQAGYYHIKPLEAGTYTLAVAAAPGGAFVATGDGTVAVLAGQQVAGPLFRGAPTVFISGQVLDDGGAPVPEANITLEIGRVGLGRRVYAADVEGRFVIDGLVATDAVRLWAYRLGARSAVFGPVTMGTEGLRAVLLRMAPA